MNRIKSNIQKGVRYLVIIIMLLNVSLMLGQKNIYKETPLVVNYTQLMDAVGDPSGFILKDSEINIPNHFSINPKAFVKLVVNTEVSPFTYSRTELDLTVIPILQNGNLDPVTTNHYPLTLTVEYNPYTNSSNFIDLSYHEALNRYGFKVVVVGFRTFDENNIQSPTINANVSMVLGFESERYYQLTEQQPNITATIVPDTDTTPVALNFNWPTLTGALEYELEWTWVDNYANDDVNSILASGSINFSDRDFELNNTRIRTNQTNYQIPLIYSRGYIVYRVRAVGRFTDDTTKTYYGPWSSGISSKTKVSHWENSFIEIGEHENIKNWQFQASYAENGKKKEVVSYFDGSLRNRQTVTKVNSDNNAIVGETIYDAQGRPAIEILPVPVTNNFIRYFKDLNKNDVPGNPFSHLDFDWQVNNQSSCDTQISGMSTSSGASNYYSRSNTIVSNFRDLIPDADKYPFSQIEYTPDNTGRISRKSGVGPAHQLGTGKEMKYFYSVPSQEELNRLFGYHVGYVSHYKKNIVVDPNEQVSVSYLDPQGRTIATALAGGSPDSLTSLEDASSGTLHQNMTVDLLAKNNPTDTNTDLDNNELITSFNFSNHKDILSLSKQIGVAGNNVEHKFKYQFNNSSYFQPDFCPEKYAFVYDLSISLKNSCGGNELTEISNQQIGAAAVGDTAPAPVSLTINQPDTDEGILLNTGTYSLVKELKVNKTTLQNYANDYIAKLRNPANVTCYINPNVFATDVDVNCNVTCSECNTSIGLEHEYVVNQLNGFYNVPEPALGFPPFFTINQSTFEVTFNNGLITEESPINFGQPIISQDVVGLVIRFRNQWKTLHAACEKLCGPTFASGCKADERALLNDVSPNGQYGLVGNFNTENDIPNVNSPILSLFNENNQIIFNGLVNNNTTVKNSWRNPQSPYLDDQGNQAYVEVELVAPNTYEPAILTGTNIVQGLTINPLDQELAGRLFVKPERLQNIADFTGNWKESWAASLLPYHPEFCYLEYSRALCNNAPGIQVYNFNVNPTTYETTVNQIVTENLTSDEYDGYLDTLDSYEKARLSGFAPDFNSSWNQIFTLDPYFIQLGSSFETLDLFNWRKAIMIEALGTQYENYTLDSDGSGNPATLFQAAVMMARCNAIQTCDYSQLNIFSSLTPTEKDKIWNTYKGLYRSLKGKIKHVFMNVYAKSEGCYNGCIGEVPSDNLSGLISNYQAATDVYNYISANNPSPSVTASPFCLVTGVNNYQHKQKRFIPIDFAYDADLTPERALNELTTLGNYQYYQQTGNCPLINDLNLYLGGFFEDANLSTNFSSLTSVTQIGQGLSRKLFGEFTGDTTSIITSAGLNLSVNDDTLNYNYIYNPSNSSGLPTPLTLSLPSNVTLSWNDYHPTNPGKWHIIGFSQLYYDSANSNLTAAVPVFAYKVVARYVINNATGEIRDMVLLGKTIARIGECHVEGDGSGSNVGEILIPETDDCNKKQLFTDALKGLILHLQETGQINDDIVISGDPYFNTNFLHTYFGIQPTDVVEWKGFGAYSQTHELFVNGNKRMTMSLYVGGQSGLNETLISLEIGNLAYSNTTHLITATFNTPNGIITHEGEILGGTPNADKTPLYFACCAPCGEWDFNGNGIGDLCDEGNYNVTVSCPNAGNQETIFEENLKQLLNDFLLPNNHQSSSSGFYMNASLTTNNPLAVDFVSESNLVEHLQLLKDFYNQAYNTTSQPASVNYYKISDFGISDSWNIIFGDNQNFDNSSFSLLQFANFSLSEVRNILFIDLLGAEIVPGFSGDVVDRVKFHFVDVNGIERTVYSYLKIGTPTDTSAWPLVQPFCNLITDNFIHPTNEKYSSPKNSSKIITTPSEEIFHPNSSCKCIPQTVEPVGCDEMYDYYINHLTTLNIQYLNINAYPNEKEDFCALNLQYLVNSYFEYLDALEITSTEDPNYLTIVQFGNTDLNYGYNHISDVITAYKNYNHDPEINTELSLWNDFVDLIYAPTMQDCPPAPMPTYSPEVEIIDPCAEIAANISATYQLDSYNTYLNFLREEFIRKYIDKAMKSVVENYDMTYKDKEYQYTLYYYDQAGNLTQTVAPENVKRHNPADLTLYNTAINNARRLNQENATVLPNHGLKTEYKYNSLNQLVWQSTPDGGITRFAYDDLGRIIASQNANQINPIIEQGYVRFSYTKYDVLGRITEAGEVHVPTSDNYIIDDQGKLIVNSQLATGFNGSFSKTEVTKTIYDEDPLVETSPSNVYASNLFQTNSGVGFNPSYNNRNRVTGVYYYNEYDSTTPENFDNGIFYNYDVHGNVKELVNYYASLKNLPASSTLGNDSEKHIKRIVYDYDLISGNVNRVTIQPNKKDQFIHRYNYDADNRIVNVETSSDGILWEKDANYQYYPHGPLARVELGDKKVQGVDYAYTLQGWLKGVNGENIASPLNDMGKDGLLSGSTKTNDAYGYSLSYFDNEYYKDYKAISLNDNGTQSYKPFMFSRNNTISGNASNLYNGNIKQMTTAIRKNATELLDVQKNNYFYDQLNRIKEMTSSAIQSTETGHGNVSTSYGSNYEYDRNGNLKKLNRSAHNQQNMLMSMDELSYNYISGKNKLVLVEDNANNSNDFDSDLEDQIDQLRAIDPSYIFNINDENTHNYRYDDIGQLTQDKSEGLTIAWRVDGKVKSVTKKDGTVISFEYDGLGNRISKTSSNAIFYGQSKTTTYYVRDAQGNTLAVYNLYSGTSRIGNTLDLVLKENHLFGSNRLGLEEKELTVYHYNSRDVIGEFELKSKIKVVDKSNDKVMDTSSMNVYTPVPVLLTRDYSLHFENNTTATWPILANGQNPFSNSEINDFTLKTKFKLNQLPSVNGLYNIGHIFYQGNPQQMVLENQADILLSEMIFNPSRPDCVSSLLNLSGTTTIFRVASSELQPIQKENHTKKTVVPDTCPTGQIEAVQNGVFAQGEDGYLEYKIISATSASNNIDVGFKITTQNTTNGNIYSYFYLFKATGTNSNLYVSSNGSATLFPMTANSTLKLEIDRAANTVKYYKNGDPLATANIFVPLNNTIIDIAFYGNLKSKYSRINELKIIKKYTDNITFTNQLALSVKKNNNSYIPIININQYKTSQHNANTTKRQVSFTPDLTPINNASDMLGQGLDIDFNVNTNSGGSLSLNGGLVTLYDATQTQWSTPLNTTLPTNITNNLGGAINGLNSLSFDMCYFNYGLGTTQNSSVINHNFSFDDVSSLTQTDNPPNEAGNQIQMTVLPAIPGVVRNLGPCLDDTDGDGIFDLYEVTEISPGNFVTIDTDGDGHPNYDDKDDDGDGIYTINEDVNPDGDRNPNTGNTLNTNGIASPTHPSMIVNTIPNYLDVDDDGDGYATWETVEGGPGIRNTSFNATITGAAYTMDSDLDGIKNYLDFTNQIYPAAIDITKNDFVNLVGDKRYELSNHLGNVLVVVNDKKIPEFNEVDSPSSGLKVFNADILSYSDYYPFGSLVPNRHGSSGSYRYGFNGKENDWELKGDGNSYDFGARMLDPRVGRWFAIDRIVKESLSTYQFSSNNPLIYIDKDGNDEFYYNLLTKEWTYRPALGPNKYYLFMPGLEKSKFELRPHDPQANGWTKTSTWSWLGTICIDDSVVRSIAKTAMHTGLTDLIKLNDPKLAKEISSQYLFLQLEESAEDIQTAAQLYEGGLGLFKIIKNGKRIYKTIAGGEKLITISKAGASELAKRIISGGGTAKSAIAEIQVAKSLAREGKTVEFLDTNSATKMADMLVDGVKADVKRTSGIGQGFAKDLRSGYDQVGEDGILYIVRGNECKADANVIIDFVKGFQERAGVKFNFKVLEQSSLPAVNIK